MSKLDAKVAIGVAKKLGQTAPPVAEPIAEPAPVDPTAAPTSAPLLVCPLPNCIPVVRAQFHVGVVLKGLSQTSIHRDGAGAMGKAQIWKSPNDGAYIHFLREKIADVYVPAANVEFFQMTDHPA